MTDARWMETVLGFVVSYKDFSGSQHCALLLPALHRFR
jgi:hypothetical protein